MWHSENFTLKQIFWKRKLFLHKLKYHFLVESIKIENASFSYKSAISETNVKTNKMVTAKWTYHKERSFMPVTAFFFWTFYFSLRTSYKELICFTNNPDDHICTFCERWSFIWWCFFPVSFLKMLSFKHYKSFKLSLQTTMSMKCSSALSFVSEEFLFVKWLSIQQKCRQF